MKDSKEINVRILCRFDEFDENVLFIVLFDYDALLQMLWLCLKPRTHRRRRRDETVELRRIGVGGVYMNSQ